MRTSPAPRGGPAAKRWLRPALRAAVVAAVLAAGTGARAESEEAGAASRGDGRPAGTGDAAIVDLQRQVNELRSELLDERERRIERRQEATGLVLVFLGIAIGIGGLWIYAKFRSIADGASIGAAAARRYMPAPRGLLSGAAAPPEPAADCPGQVPYLVAADSDSAPASPARAAANGSAASAAVPLDHAAGLPCAGPDPEDLQRHEEEIADCSEAIRLDPRNPALYLERAAARSTAGRFEEAVSDYDRAIRLDPDHAAAYIGRCRAKSELGQHEDAVEDYDHAVRLDPDAAAA